MTPLHSFFTIFKTKNSTAILNVNVFEAGWINVCNSFEELLLILADAYFLTRINIQDNFFSGKNPRGWQKLLVKHTA